MLLNIHMKLAPFFFINAKGLKLDNYSVISIFHQQPFQFVSMGDSSHVASAYVKQHHSIVQFSL